MTRIDLIEPIKEAFDGATGAEKDVVIKGLAEEAGSNFIIVTGYTPRTTRVQGAMGETDACLYWPAAQLSREPAAILDDRDSGRGHRSGPYASLEAS